jgi:flavin-dependent dehydrogenase
VEQYDVVVVGGGIAGSVAARFAAEAGLRTLLIEKYETPRNKSCSGIQFSYFEKLVGASIPQDKLCDNRLYKVEIVAPSGKTLEGQMEMFNFWRSTFDRWLNDVAVGAGAVFQDDTRLVDFEKDAGGVVVQIRSDQDRQVKARYLIAADGLYSQIRRALRPADYQKGPAGSLNYYCRGETAMDPNTLYMVFNRAFAPVMFAWAYLKDDQWVIGTGTGTGESPKEYADRFFDYMQDRYCFRGEIVRREGFGNPLVGGVYLGEGPVLFTGDAAGLIDMYRGVGMDNAALSARFAIKAIVQAERTGRSALGYYQRLMRGMVHKIEVNARRQERQFAANETLEANLAPVSMLRQGLLMMVANLANKVLPPERVITLPL